MDARLANKMLKGGVSDSSSSLKPGLLKNHADHETCLAAINFGRLNFNQLGVKEATSSFAFAPIDFCHRTISNRVGPKIAKQGNG